MTGTIRTWDEESETWSENLLRYSILSNMIKFTFEIDKEEEGGLCVLKLELAFTDDDGVHPKQILI